MSEPVLQGDVFLTQYCVYRGQRVKVTDHFNIFLTHSFKGFKSSVIKMSVFFFFFFFFTTAYKQTGCTETHLRCNNTACYDSKYQCIYGFSRYGYPLGCRDATHLADCGKVAMFRRKF